MLLLIATVMIFLIAILFATVKYSDSPIRSVVLMMGSVVFSCSIFFLIVAVVGIVIKNEYAFNVFIISIIGLIFGMAVKYLNKNSSIRS